MDKVLNTALLIGCAYEIVALATELPTITRMLRVGGSRHPIGKIGLWIWCGYISWHFLEPLPKSDPQ